MSNWNRPSCRSDEIERILSSVQRYDPSVAPILEDYLAQQVADDEYDAYANIALLKLIQFNESLANPEGQDADAPDSISLVLAKALAHEPFGPDFNLCMALLVDRFSPTLSSPAAIQGLESATKLSTALKQRDFVKFWSLLKEHNSSNDTFSTALHSLPHFNNLVRRSIGKCIADTFRSVDKARANKWLGYSAEDNELSAFIVSMGWTLDGENVRIPSTEANDPKSSVQSETVDLARLVRTLGQSIQA